ncbi:MAG: RNA polymerase sigma factor [Actinomycetia bacterium]|nr:RNA polymerase sigma factor [Actinomycetes bacterium]
MSRSPDTDAGGSTAAAGSDSGTATELNLLIKTAVAGERSALEALVIRFRKMIAVSCSLQLDDPSHAEDVAQDVIAQVIANIGQLKNPEAFTAWLQRIITRACLRANQRRRKHQDCDLGLESAVAVEMIERQLAGDPNDQPEARMDALEARELLLGCLKKLTTAQRTALTLHYFGGFSYKEIAKILQVQVGSVASNISKGKQALNRLLIEKAEDS